MAEAARAPINASNTGMASPALKAEFWAAVEDCLVQFHQFAEARAREEVRNLWRRLAQPSIPEDTGIEGYQPFEDMIYHSEPWYIACNLAGRDIPLDSHKMEYDKILKNHLA